MTHQIHKAAKEQLLEWMQIYQASTEAGWGYGRRIPHTKPKGDDQPDKRQAGRETKTKSIDNPEQIQDFQSTIVTWPSKVTHRQMRTARKRDLSPPSANKKKTLEPWHITKTKHSSVSKKTQDAMSPTKHQTIEINKNIYEPSNDWLTNEHQSTHLHK